jgi:hypothetical protein
MNVTGQDVNASIIQSHHHNTERWFGATAGVAPAIAAISSRFRVTTHANADTFGTAVAIFNGAETLGAPFQTLFDFHRIHITDVESNGLVYKLRFIFNLNGESTAAASVTNNHYTEVCLKIDQTNADSMPIPVMSGQVPVGTKVWCQAMNSAGGAKYIDFLVGIHLYPARP